MKLFHVPTSPFVRKVVVTGLETGLDPRIEKVTVPMLPLLAPEVRAANPLGKVPTLITDGGEVLYDSPVICEYLDSLHGGRRLFPAEGGARWRALRWQALGDGILDCAVALRYESLRPAGERSAAWIAKQSGKVGDAVAALDDEAEALDRTPVTIGHIAIGCALAYLDLRLADLAWRDGRPAIAAWYAAFAARPSMAATAFPAA